MWYKSLNGHSEKVDFKTAVLGSLAPDKGLYFPEKLPVITADVLANYKIMDLPDLAYECIKGFVADSIPVAELKQIIKDTLNFPTPIVPLKNDNVYALELFHGPTLAFKDVGARFMARCLGYFLKGSTKKTTVLVATSGDTGGAVADGFYGVEGIEVIILYPSGKVSPLQEKQLTALGKNIKALEVEGTFDDCQNIVKQAFLDESINIKHGLTSANSINVARWLPQMFYYLSALQQIEEGKEVVFSVPSGNFGNICAGMMVQQLGFPIQHFIAATNANNVVTNYMNTEVYAPKPTVSTISNAMDVSTPSNFIRIQSLYKNFSNLSDHLTSNTFTDQETKEVMKEVYEQTEYILDPHGAVAYLGLKAYLEENSEETENIQGVFLETAHPVKFVEVVEEVLGFKLDIPTELERLMKQEKVAVVIPVNYEAFKAAL